MRSQILDVILTNTYTLPDLKHRVRILKEVLENRIFGGSDLKLAAPDSNWVETLAKDFLSQFNKDNLYQLFDSMDETINNIPPLVIYLAFEPNEETKAQISQWLRSNLTKKFIFEIKLDPSLIGGAALVWQGVYKDYSLRTKIEVQKEVILTEFKKYIT